MKKLSVGIIALLCVCVSSQALIVTNSSYNVIGSSAGNNYNDFKWDAGSYSDVVLSWDFDQDLTGVSPFFRMSQMTDTGRVVYVNLSSSNSDLAVSGTNVTMTLVRTNMPPRSTYDAELSGIDVSGYRTAVSRGKLNITMSLFDPAITNFPLPEASTNVTLQNVLENGNVASLNINLTGAAMYQTNGVDLDFASSSEFDTLDGLAIKKDGSVVYEADQNFGTNDLLGVQTLQGVAYIPSTWIASQQYYDPRSLTWSMDTGVTNVSVQVGQEFHHLFYNGSGGTLTNGTLVYQTGSTNITVAPGVTITVANVSSASAEDITKIRTIGMMTHDAPDGTFGLATVKGFVRSLDTSACSPADVLYLNGGTFSRIPGTFAIKIGACEVVDATDGIVFVDIGQWMGDGFSERTADALSVQRQSLFVTNVAGTVYAEIDDSGSANDITYRFGGADYLLDCTTGSGAGGRARSSALTVGTDTVPVLNYIYVVPDTYPSAKLTNSTTHPNGDTFAWVGIATLQSAATTLTDGVLALQRYSDTFAHNGRGRMSYNAERIRQLGAGWDSGCAVTVTDDASGGQTVAVASGIVYQMHRQTFPAFSDPATMYVVNDPDTPFRAITNLNQITKDADGDLIANRDYFGVRIIGYVSSGDDGTSRLYIQLPTGVYVTQSGAEGDTSAFDVNSMPNSLKGGSFNLARVIILKQNPSGDFILVSTQDKRGELLNAQGTGGGASEATTFPDTTFRVFDDGDSTKQIAFQASGITSGQTRTLTVQDRDGVLAYRDVDETFEQNVTVTSNLTVNVGATIGGASATTMLKIKNTIRTNTIQSALSTFQVILDTGVTTFDVLWGGTTEYNFTPTELDLHGNNLTNAGAITATGTVTGGDLAGDSVTFTTNSTKQFTGTLNTTNYVGWSVGTNSYLIMFDVP